MFLFGIKKIKYPKLGVSMKSAEDVANELNNARDKQLEAARQGRKDLEVVYKSRFETLCWVLGKEYDSATVR